MTHNSLNELNDSLQSNVEKDYVVVVGDLNLPELRSSEDDVRALSDEQFPSDRYPIEFFIKQTFKRAYRVRSRVYDFRRGQFKQLQTFLQRSAIEVTFSGNIDECWVQWKTQFQEAVDQFIPSKTIVDKDYLPWIDREVQHLIRKKYTA